MSSKAGLDQAAAAPGRSLSLLPLLVAVLLIPAVLGSSSMIFNDGDVSWHIATGQWILDHRAIPRTDPFSYTWGGKPWVPIEWLAEVMLGAAYRLAGHSGVAALVTAALMALNAIVFVNTRRSIHSALVAVIAMDFVLIPMTLARPHVLTWPLLALWVWLMLRAREQNRAPPLLAALLLTVWANLHGSFMLGLGIAGAFGLEALISAPDRGRAFRQWLVFGIACVIAVFINANGIAGVWHPFYMTGQATLPLIQEWKPSSPVVTPFFFAVLAIAIGLIAWKRPRLHPVRWLMLAALLGLALFQVRHQSVLAIVAAMLLPQGFARGAMRATPVEAGARIAVLAGAALLILVRALMPIQLPENDSNPWKLIAAVPTPLRSEPVLNGYSMGGPLILSGIRPFIDGRADMYGDEFVANYARLTKGDSAAFDQAVRRWDIRWAILPVGAKAMIGLAERAGWRRIASDKVGAVYVREGAMPVEGNGKVGGFPSTGVPKG
ncbi:MAG TPA: hypothetical protein VFK19_05815 [Sphingomicrobium sp.]|nr:hypothetical protein [Sphingomicrobium sp.]